MTMPYERTRSVVWAEELFNELLDSQRHPETTAETRHQIKAILRHFPRPIDLNMAAMSDPQMWSKAGATFNDG